MKANLRLHSKIALLSSVLVLPTYAIGDTQQELEDKAEEAKAEMQAESANAQADIQDAWREGKLESAFLFNRHLNNLSIDVEVDGSTAKLSGKVESEVDRELAKQVALSVDGIEEVDSALEIASTEEARDNEDNSDRAFSDKVEDATLTAEIKLKLLANGETGGLSIDVDTRDKSVTLSGKVDSAAEKALAEQLAANVDGVKGVDNKLKVENS